MSNRLELTVELIDQGNTSRDVEREYVLVGDSIEIFNERSQAIAVRGNDRSLTTLNCRHNCLMPVRKEASNCVLQTF